MFKDVTILADQFVVKIEPQSTLLLSSIGVSKLEQFVAVEEKGHRAVVGADDLHGRGEDACFHDDALFTNRGDGFLVQCVCPLRFCGLVKAGSPSLSAVAVQCELADDQHLPRRLADVAVHLTIVVGKDSQLGNLGRHKLHIRFAVALAHTQINQQSVADLADDLTCYLSLGV